MLVAQVGLNIAGDAARHLAAQIEPTNAALYAIWSTDLEAAGFFGELSLVQPRTDPHTKFSRRPVKIQGSWRTSLYHLEKLEGPRIKKSAKLQMKRISAWMRFSNPNLEFFTKMLSSRKYY